MTTRRGFTPVELVIALLIVVLCGFVLTKVTSGRRPMNGRDRCEAMLTMARSATDSLLVYTAKPDSKYSTCADHLIRGTVEATP